MDTELTRTSIEAISRTLVESAPADWKAIRLEVRQVGWSATGPAWVTHDDVVWTLMRYPNLIDNIDNLRDATASPGTLSPRVYADELENWPRDPEHIPDWFSQRMSELG